METKSPAFEDKSMEHAPVEMDNREASAWAEGYNDALERTAASDLLESLEWMVGFAKADG